MMHRGDIVQQQRGDGPDMTLRSFDADGAAHCAWFTDRHEVRQEVCPPDELRVVDSLKSLAHYSASQHFSKGDRVRLRSGGPEMIVHAAAGGNEDNMLHCAWEELTNGTTLRDGTFYVHDIEVIDETRGR